MTRISNGVIAIDDPAPTFVLSAVNREGQAGLDDYRGRSGLFLNVVRGL